LLTHKQTAQSNPNTTPEHHTQTTHLGTTIFNGTNSSHKYKNNEPRKQTLSQQNNLKTSINTFDPASAAPSSTSSHQLTSAWFTRSLLERQFHQLLGGWVLPCRLVSLFGKGLGWWLEMGCATLARRWLLDDSNQSA
jgi:hypothetical protein